MGKICFFLNLKKLLILVYLVPNEVAYRIPEVERLLHTRPHLEQTKSACFSAIFSSPIRQLNLLLSNSLKEAMQKAAHKTVQKAIHGEARKE